MTALQEDELFMTMSMVLMSHGVADPDFKERHVEDLTHALVDAVKLIIKEPTL